MHRPLAPLAALLLAAPPALAQWTAAPAFPDPAPRLDAVGLSLGGEVLAVGGSPLQGGDSNGVCHGLVPGAGAWSAHAELEGPVVGQGGGVDALGRIVVFGGLDALDPEGDVGKAYWYDLVEGKKGGVPDRTEAAPHVGFAWATDAAGRIYSLGGGPGAAGGNSAHAERYDALANVWEVVAPLPAARAAAASCADGAGRLLVVGGYGPAGGAPLASALAYDPATDAWGAVAPCPEPIADARAALGADGRVYVVGGTDAASAVSPRTWVWDPTVDAWAAGPDLAVPRRRHGLALGPDDRIWALGGDDGAGGTNTVEALYTPPCPLLGPAPADVATWVGLDATLHVAASGGAPLALRWERDGLPLDDGPAPGGGTYSGAHTDTLRLVGAGAADAGSYRLVASNPCGGATSDAVALAVQAAPELGPWRGVQRFTPGAAATSSASALDGTAVFGHALAPAPPHPDQNQAVAWRADGALLATLTPPQSVGCTVAAAEAGAQVGSWWWPYTTPQGTGYYLHAGRWEGDAASHLDLQPTGWEIGSLSDTDGSRHVGTLRRDETSTTVDAGYWPGNAKYAVILTPAVAWGSSGAALDGDRQYGSVNLGFGVVHAARWSGTAASFEDLNPPGSSWSSVAGADAGQAVGFAQFAGVRHAWVWGADPAGGLDLHPAGAVRGELVATDAGVQLGHLNEGAGDRPTLWGGAPDERVDLLALLQAGGGPWTSAQVRDVELAPSGRVAVAGSAFDPVAGVAEAIVWHVQPDPLVAEPAALSLAAGGRQELFLAAGDERAGLPYFVLGSASGAAPGVPLPGLTVPLNVDPYLLWTLAHPNGAVLDDTLGVLNAWGAAHAAIAVPPATDPSLAGAALHHAFVVVDPSLGVAFASNAAPLALGS